ncbi:hypothetical protein BBJ28_00010529 [Nothophytophthora sp. Chile5]|nr:hypothetical protein BBJ28_00010529 [Nothophytophthora sp. Chile5]
MGVCYESGIASDLSQSKVDSITRSVLQILQLDMQSMEFVDAMGQPRASDSISLPATDMAKRDVYEITQVFKLTESGFRWADGVGEENFQRIPAGQPIGFIGSGESQPFVASYDAHIVFPKIPALWKIGSASFWRFTWIARDAMGGHHQHEARGSSTRSGSWEGYEALRKALDGLATAKGVSQSRIGAVAKLAAQNAKDSKDGWLWMEANGVLVVISIAGNVTPRTSPGKLASLLSILKKKKEEHEYAPQPSEQRQQPPYEAAYDNKQGRQGDDAGHAAAFAHGYEDLGNAPSKTPMHGDRDGIDDSTGRRWRASPNAQSGGREPPQLAPSVPPQQARPYGAAQAVYNEPQGDRGSSGGASSMFYANGAAPSPGGRRLPPDQLPTSTAGQHGSQPMYTSAPSGYATQGLSYSSGIDQGPASVKPPPSSQTYPAPPIGGNAAVATGSKVLADDDDGDTAEPEFTLQYDDDD